ncbi:histidine triad nucleotide-binding protein [Rubritalea sp.]|uniref:histidine triad nucleotide-binding protein n=1 Tax=Rubritalea sp. TaxID=2109375 RepID=UPI003EF26C28
MSDKTIFEMIIDREIPADIVHEDDLCICFRDINPQAPIHLLVVPKKRIVRISESSSEDQATLGHLMLTVNKVAHQEGITESGFRTVINNGPHGGEEVPHLHLHILAGRQMQWPPG